MYDMCYLHAQLLFRTNHIDYLDAIGERNRNLSPKSTSTGAFPECFLQAFGEHRDPIFQLGGLPPRMPPVPLAPVSDIP